MTARTAAERHRLCTQLVDESFLRSMVGSCEGASAFVRARSVKLLQVRVRTRKTSSGKEVGDGIVHALAVGGPYDGKEFRLSVVNAGDGWQVDEDVEKH